MSSNRLPDYFTFLSSSKIDDLRALDPSAVRTAVEYIVIHNLTTQLIELDQRGQYKARLAEKVDLAADRKSATIHLASKTFSNGDPILAADVAGTFKRLILKGSPHSAPKKFIKGAAGLKSMADSCAGIEIRNSSTVVLTFNYPVKEILYYLQLADYGILHKSQYSKDGDLTTKDWKVTSGPYSLEKDKGGEYFMSWNESYGPGATRIRKIKAAVSDGSGGLRDALSDRRVQLGMVGFRDYYLLIQRPEAIKHVELVGSKYQAVSMLLLNVENSKFKSPATRKWLQKRIVARLAVPPKYENLLEKSYEYFLPAAPGYVDPGEVRKIVGGIAARDAVPAELRDGINIRCRKDYETWMPAEMESLLQEALGVKVRLTYDIPLENYRGIIKERNFEALLLNPSMSYKVLGESLTLWYVTEPRHFLDPSGKVKENLDRYYRATRKDAEARAIRDIMISMTRDSEMIPLYYNGYMEFYDKELLDASEVSFFESFEIRNYHVR